jgi:hypothetical protein
MILFITVGFFWVKECLLINPAVIILCGCYAKKEEKTSHLSKETEAFKKPIFFLHLQIDQLHGIYFSKYIQYYQCN